MPVVEEILESSLHICEKHEQGELETIYCSQHEVGRQQKRKADEPGEGR